MLNDQAITASEREAIAEKISKGETEGVVNGRVVWNVYIEKF